jgi:two-component system response regulator WspF
LRIGIVNDSRIAVEALRRALALDPSLSLYWVAENGAEAVDYCKTNPPDLILMDLIMPVMDGVEATRRIMRDTPCQILVVTASVTGNAGKVFEAMGAGALDAVAVPVLEGKRNTTEQLLKKIQLIGKLAGIQNQKVEPQKIADSTPNRSECGAKLVAIGCSTGGPHAALTILSSFPTDFPAAFVLVQHMDERFTQGLADWLDQQVNLSVRILRENDQLQPGVVLVPSARGHVALKSNCRIGYLGASAGSHYVPSVDVFFKSVAEQWSGNMVGVLLTGMGRDGAEGLLALRQQGFHTIAQNRETCVVFGMPKAAIELNAAEDVLPLNQIGPRIASIIGARR